MIVAADVDDAQLEAASPWIDAGLNTLDLEPVDVAKRLNDLAGTHHGVDVAFETAGHPASLDAMVRLPRPGGTAMLMGICDGPTAISFENYLSEFVRREVNLTTTFGFTRQDFLIGNALYLSNRVDVSRLIGATVGLDEVADVLDHIVQHGTEGKRYVVHVGTRNR
jgi:threonine dehydrogenase-like Zn-dependent dehydrogenase